MLVLTRRVGESIRIGDDIVITVLEPGREQVRIGISAPRSVSVHREEVYQEILLENQAAAADEGVPHDGARVVVVQGSSLTPRKRPG